MDAHEAEYRQRLQSALGPDFELRDLIGRGGFGAVYSAWDKKLEREVAVKALRHDMFPTPIVLERFQREARALAQLRHAHILPVYEVGVGDGIAFMVMPFIRGETLGDILRRGERLAVADAIRIVAEVARALEAAHQAGIVHRDVKPDNILIEGRERHAVLSDFGIAKASGGSELTGSGVAIGSPQYMSPEQASAERNIDARSDIYSLGSVAYEMFAGRRVYEADSLQRLLVLQFTTEPAPLADAAIPELTRQAVMRALARDPAARWQSAAEFGSALTPATVSVAPESESWLARRGLQLAGLNFVGVTLIGMTSWVFSQDRSGSMRFANNVLAKPMTAVIGVLMFAMIVELIVTLWLAGRRNRTNRVDAMLRAGFGQPRWWQPWYMKRLRAPDNAWDVMPFSMKALRTVLWLEIVAIPFVFPMLYVFPTLSRMTAEGGMPLPLPVRLAFGFTRALELPLQLGAPLVVLGALGVSLTKRVPFGDVFRLLLTWRRAAWDAPAAAPLRVGRASATEPTVTEGARNSRAWLRWTIAALAVIGVVAVSLKIRPNSAASTRSIAVLPCENAIADSASDYLAEGLSDEVRSGLSGLRGVSVMARASSLLFRGAEPDLRRIGARLRVGEVVQCSFRARAGQLRVTAELVSVPGGTTSWARTFNGTEADLQPIRDSIIGALASRLGVREEPSARGTSGPSDREAYNLFLKGEYQRHRGELPRAISLLREAATRDPGLARAHGALAAAYANLPALGFASPESTAVLARAAAARALALDPAEVMAHSAEGIVAQTELRMADAERIFAAILARDSTNAEAVAWRAVAFAWLGRTDEALAHSRLARRLDPLSLEANIVTAYFLFASRRFEEAILEAHSALELDPNNVIALENLAVSLVFANHLDSAVVVARRVAAIGASNFGGRAYLMFAFAAAERWDEADKQQRLLLSESGNSVEFNKAFSHLVNSRHEAAVLSLVRAFQRREPLIAINLPGCDPMWDPLKTNPRFTALLARHGATPCPALPSWPIKPRPK